MNKLIITGSFLLLTFALPSKAQKILFECDFEQGIPETFLCYDEDGNEPARGMKKYGLENGTAWAGYTEDAGTDIANGTAYSGSWYKEPAQSNDWLVTPEIIVTSKQAILSWKAHATDPDHRDGYAVYITDAGDKPADFKESPVFSIEKENVTWTEHSLSLEKWAGKHIRIAFVNNSTDCKLLALDNINVYVHEHSFIYISQTPEAISAPGNIRVKGGITPSGFLPIDGYKVVLNYNRDFFTENRSEESIQVGDTAYFEFTKDIPVALDQTVDYTISVSSGTEDILTEAKSITCFERTVIAEEGTGTWCMYCPRGQIGMEMLREKYGKQFIDIAAHVNDPMEEIGYTAGIRPFLSQGIPYCVMNRNPELTGDPYHNVEELFLKALGEGPLAKITCEASLTEEKKLSVKAVAEFAKPIDKGLYNLSFIVVEDSVTGYSQANAYAGGNEKIGNLADLPDPIPAGEYYFANVGRAAYPSFSGDEEAFGTPTQRRTPIEVARTYEVPASVKNIHQVKIVAIVIDAKSGKALNAAECPLNIPPSAIAASATRDAGVYVTSERNGSIKVETANHIGISFIEIYTSEGKLIRKALPGEASSCVINIDDNQGIGIVKVGTPDSVVTKKVKL